MVLLLLSFHQQQRGLPQGPRTHSRWHSGRGSTAQQDELTPAASARGAPEPVALDPPLPRERQ
jgi:hypothetical protein